MEKKFDFICFSLNNWEKRKARKQQFMRYLSEREDVGRVLYVEPSLNFFRLFFFAFSELKTKEDRQRWWRALNSSLFEVSDKLSVFTPVRIIPFGYRSKFIYELNLFFTLTDVRRTAAKLKMGNIVMWLYYPYDLKLLKWFGERALSVFDWAEDWGKYYTELSAGRRRVVSELEDKVASSADIVFAPSRALLERARRNNPVSFILLDGTVPEIFSGYKGPVPQGLKGVRHPVIGYTGSVFERVDLELVSSVAKEFSEASVVFVGNVLLGKERLAGLAAMKNIYFLGGKSYSELPAYMNSFDVCILPYYASEYTSPPTKVYDYLATGKPIVSMYLKELKSFEGLVQMARTKEDFVALIRQALEGESPELPRLRRERAGQNSWACRAQEIMDILKGASHG